MKSFLRTSVYKILTAVMDREKLIRLLASKDKVDRELFGFKYGGYLFDIGWTNSVATENVVGLSNKPLPWVTYPFIEFIAERLKNNLEIFEFGCGNSTLYYADKVA